MESASAPTEPVLCVDLDGSLCRGDAMLRCGLRLAASRPWLLPRYAVWALQGRARLKAEIARRVAFDPKRLVYCDELVEWLRGEKAKGRKVVIASGADRRIVAAVAVHLGLFDDIVASEGTINLTGANKAAALARRYGDFAYVGNAPVDVAVWRRASASYLVARSPRRAAKLSRQIAFVRVFS